MGSFQCGLCRWFNWASVNQKQWACNTGRVACLCCIRLPLSNTRKLMLSYKLINHFPLFVFPFFSLFLRVQEEGISWQTGHRHNSKLYQQKHHRWGKGRGDKWSCLHLQPEILSGSQTGSWWAICATLASKNTPH